MDQLLRAAAHIPVVACTAVLAVSIPSIASGASTSVGPARIVHGDVAIAGFKAGGSLADAVTVFGKPDVLREDVRPLRRCRATWVDVGLALTFQGDGCAAPSLFLQARITGRTWRTLRGVGVGATLAELRRKYPDARRANGGTWILLSRGRVPTLMARLERGRVQSLLVSAYSTTVRW